MTNFLIQGSKEWLEFRKNFIGASDSSIILGISPYMTPYLLYLDKLGLYEQEESVAMRFGKENEETARIMFNERTGLEMIPNVKVHLSINYLMASLDGMTKDGWNIVEIKCNNRDNHNLALSGKIADYHFPQVQHQMEVCGLDMAYYCSFYNGEICIVEIYRDQPFIDNLLEKYKEFWNCVQTFTPPPFITKDYIQRNDIEWMETAHQWREVQIEMKSLERREKDLRDKLIYLSDDKNCICGGVKMTKITRKGNVDYSKISALDNIDLEVYRKDSIVSYRLTEEK